MNILLVDDDPAALHALRELLSPLAADIRCARSGEEALRLVLKHDFAVIVLDVRLPGMDGFEVAAAVRELPRSRHIPILFVSAYDDRRQRQRLRSEEFLRKPLAPESVLAKVTSLLGARQRASGAAFASKLTISAG